MYNGITKWYIQKEKAERRKQRLNQRVTMYHSWDVADKPWHEDEYSKLYKVNRDHGV